MELYIIAYIGLLLHWGFMFNSAWNKVDYDWLTFIKKNIYAFILQVVITGIAIYAKDEIYQYVGLSVGKVASLFIGYLSGDIFNRVLKVARRKVEKIGEISENDINK